jgi:predicted Zn-dependent protease
MKNVILALALLFTATPAFAQFGQLSKLKQQADRVKKISDMNISDKDERVLGEQVSTLIRTDFGVYQDDAVATYVTLVGNVLAQASSRPNLDWQFIVLDTDGVNAFAAPGGIVHITRGALGLIKNEAQLAGVLGHEITHITAKHTINAIQKNNMVSFTAEEAGNQSGFTGAMISKLAQAAYKNILNNKFDRGDENESDRVGVQLAAKLGYAPAGLAEVLTSIADRNKDQAEPNGMFASHPLIKDRIVSIEKTIKEQNLTGSATVAARYTGVITFDAKPLSEIAITEAGARGLAGGEPAKDDKDKDKKDEGKKKGGFLGKVGLTSGQQAQNTQTVASAGARGGVPDRDAKGGGNPSVKIVKVSPAELEAFKKGIA